MKQLARLIALLFTVNQSFGQIAFEKGYFIDSNNVKTECLIKNIDWKNNPSKFRYKLTDSAEVRETGISEVREFGIVDFSRYVRANVKIDRSSTQLDKLSDKRNPIWSDEQLFLKEIVCGDASLFSYTDPDRTWFFYSINGADIQQLVFKEYLVEGRNSTNNAFRQQIRNEISNENTTSTNPNRLKYEEKELICYFKLYNRSGDYCTRTDFTKKTREIFNFKVFAVAENSAISFNNSAPGSWTWNFDKKTYLSYGLQAEYFLRFWKNSLSAFVEPTYQAIDNSKTISSIDRNASLRIHTIDFPIGLRYNLYIGNKFKCFVNGIFNSSYCVNFNSEFKSNFWSSMVINPGSNLALGAGIGYNRLNAELRAYTNRQLIEGLTSPATDYKKLAFILSYKFYQKKGK